MPLDEARRDKFVGKMPADIGAAMTAARMLIGDKLGPYRKLAKAPVTAAALATRSGTSERCVRQWLAAQPTAGYAAYDAEDERCSLSPEQSVVLADEQDAVPSSLWPLPWRTP